VTDAPAATPSVTARIQPLAAGAPVVGVHFLGDSAVFVLGEEALLLAPLGGEPKRVGIHDGGILASCCDGARVVTGGDDGKVMATDTEGTSTPIAADAKNRWIDHVAVGPDGAVAWSAGKTATVRTRKGDEHGLDVVSTVGGLTFAPKGLRLAIAHYNGATLWFPNAQAAPEKLEWKGSHLGVAISPDGKFLVTTMQEPALHGWRLTDGQHMRMAGYAGRVRSFAWTASGDWLATSGAAEVVLWPFQGKDGPMGKQPMLLAPLEAGVAVVACHPSHEIIATGYRDGTILLLRLDGGEILAREPAGSPVSALAWNAAGTLVAFGTEDGQAGVIDLR
jgi:WD40 repeat protein